MRVRTLLVSLVTVTLPAFLAARSQDGPPPDPVAAAGDDVFFNRHVMPLIDKLGCSTAKCHGAPKSGLRLSLFGAAPRDDYAALTRMAGGRELNRVEPARSLLLLKTTESIAHAGGKNIEVGSPQYDMLLRWIAQGALWDDEQLPELLSIDASPEEDILDKGDSQQLKVSAVFSDGRREDVTRNARYSSADGAVASVDASGAVKAEGLGRTAIIVAYLRRFDVVPIVVPQPLPSPFPEAAANNRVDDLVFANLKKLGIPPSDLCSDHEFLRRVHLDVIGTLPTPDQVRQFLSDSDPQKRIKLIDRLLDSDDFADYWALKWGDLFRIKSEYPSNLWPNAVQAYHRWIRDGIARNKPYDQFARELLTSSGSNFRNPQANYYRAFLQRDPRNLGEVSALIFMGARMGCARCHGHPTESWSLDDNLGLAAFFAKVRYKRTREWKEEIVYIHPRQTMRHPRTASVVPPQFPGGDALELEPGEDPRARFAQWLTSPENPWFARNIVNRIWFWLLGRGIIHEPDDLRSTNLPENPELLQYLESELVSHKYDLKHIYRLILNSRTYQLSAKANQFNRDDVAHFSHYQVKRLGAETLLDAIGQVTERWDTFRSYIPEPFVVMPQAFRATHLADGSIDLPFLQLFGRPPRDTAYESDRDLELSMRQTLHLLNSSDVQNKINASPRLRRLLQDATDDSRIVEELYLSTLSRFPTDDERQRISDYMSGAGKTIPQAVAAEQKAAQEALAEVRAELERAKAAHQGAENSAREATTAATAAKTAADKAAAAQGNAEQTAATKRHQASEAKKAEELAQNDRKSAATQHAAAAKAVTDAGTAKTAADEALVEANAALARSQQAYDTAEKAAQEAELKAKEIAEDPERSAEEKKQAAATAEDKRQAAKAAKTDLSQAQESQEKAQSREKAAAQKLADAEAQKQTAEQAVANIENQVAAAVGASQAAEKAASEAERGAAQAKTAADKARAALARARSAAAEKRKLADQAKAKRDNLVKNERSANARSARANKAVDTAKAALKPRRDQAIRDLLWALLNTKEFVFNH